MDHQIFRTRFLEGVVSARTFAQGFVEEKLPSDCVFHLHLNQSNDANASSDAVLFPEDSSDEMAFRLKHISSDEVIDTLWRDGMVPEWVNLSVVGETGSATLVDVVACGRFTADDSRLYHRNQGRAPFHILGPELPIDYVEGRPFSVHARSSCWTIADLSRAQQHASQVWSLVLNGPAFSDGILDTGLRFPRIELLELSKTSVTGTGLGAIAAAPRLRVLRLTCGQDDLLDLGALPVMPAIRVVSLSNLPSTVIGLERLSEAFPMMSELSLSSSKSLLTDVQFAGPRLEQLSLNFPTVQSWSCLAPRAKSLSLVLRHATDEQIAQMVNSARMTLASVTLRGTPVTDEILSTLLQVPNLAFVDLVDTRVTAKALESLTRTKPSLKYFPRTPKASDTKAV